MSISSTGLYGSATIVNTDLFDDVEVLKQDINDTSVNKIQAIKQDINDISVNKIPGIILDVSHNKATITYTQA